MSDIKDINRIIDEHNNLRKKIDSLTEKNHIEYEINVFGDMNGKKHAISTHIRENTNIYPDFEERLVEFLIDFHVEKMAICQKKYDLIENFYIKNKGSLQYD